MFVIIQGTADDGARDILAEKDLLCFETLEEALRVLERWMSALALPQKAATLSAQPTFPRVADYPTHRASMTSKCW